VSGVYIQRCDGDAASPPLNAWEAIAEITAIGPGRAVLDVGCGTGGFCRLAAGRGAVVHGVDGMPDRVATARRRVPAGDFRVGLMEHLPWPTDAFHVVTGFNSFQYALDIAVALTEACRVARPEGQVAVCKYGRPIDNEFFAFLGALDPNGVRLESLPEIDAVDRAIERLELNVLSSGEVPAAMEFPTDEALAAALASAGSPVGLSGYPAWRCKVAAAASPYRQSDSSYRFENRLKYRIIAP
jgi:SAM-dependent methyltransferase